MFISAPFSVSVRAAAADTTRAESVRDAAAGSSPRWAATAPACPVTSPARTHAASVAAATAARRPTRTAGHADTDALSEASALCARSTAPAPGHAALPARVRALSGRPRTWPATRGSAGRSVHLPWPVLPCPSHR